MKGQGNFLKLRWEKKDYETNYYLCIWCKEKPRDRSFFCSKCFNKDFMEKLKVFCDWQIKKGFKNPDSYMLKSKHYGRLPER